MTMAVAREAAPETGQAHSHGSDVLRALAVLTTCPSGRSGTSAPTPPLSQLLQPPTPLTSGSFMLSQDPANGGVGRIIHS